jgi:Flp pilus assembly protein TadB
MDLGLYGYLTLIAFVLVLVFAACAFVHVNRMRNRRVTPISEQVGSVKAVMDKVRKRQPMSTDELELAKRVIGDRRSLMAYSIPAALFTMGCFYVLGSLEHLHGATPSERTFLGVIPMLTSTSLTIRMLSGARLKGRLPKSAWR